MFAILNTLEAVLGVASIYLLSRLFKLLSRKAPARLPPGPKPSFLLGNIRDLPPPGEVECLFWAKHKNLYGPLSCLSVLGRKIMIVSDAKIAFDLFEKRNSIYSDRPIAPFTNMCGMANVLPLVPDASSYHFRSYRKLLHQVIGTKAAVSKFNALLDAEIRHFALRLLEDPQQLKNHLRTKTGAAILKISHGYSIEHSRADPFVDLADKFVEEFCVAAMPGRWLVDIIPALKYLPSWLPGMGFKRIAEDYSRTSVEITEKPLAFVKHQIANGNAQPSFSVNLLSKDVSEEEEFIIKNAAMSLYAGGADTTRTAEEWFFIAMVLYPEVQKKAQREIDTVVGTDRLPNFDDRPSLPYVNALVKEVLRWQPVAPMGMPHLASQDDVYQDMFIPKGTILVPNIRVFTHDAVNYKNPDKFRPERFLGEDPEMDPNTLCFGFGRRICPGRELADSDMFLTAAVTLAAFDIVKTKNANYSEDESSLRFMSGVVSHPIEFECEAKPRNMKSAELVRAIEYDHPLEKSDAAVLQDLVWA